MILERNETYYGTKPTIKNVLAYMIVEQSSAVGVFDGGSLDIVPELPSNDIRVLKNRKEYCNFATKLGNKLFCFSNSR